jgi:hypothetical protein
MELLTALTTTWHRTPSHPAQNLLFLQLLLYFPTQILIFLFLNCLWVNTPKLSGQENLCPCQIRYGHIMNTGAWSGVAVKALRY